MQPNIFEGDSASTPNDIGGVRDPNQQQTLAYTSSAGEMAGRGPIGRYASGVYDWFGQARAYWDVQDIYAQQHTVDGYRFELGNTGDPGVIQRFIDDTLNNIDNCLARRVAYGLGAKMPGIGSCPRGNSTKTYPSQYPLNPYSEPHKSNEGIYP